MGQERCACSPQPSPHPQPRELAASSASYTGPAALFYFSLPRSCCRSPCAQIPVREASSRSLPAVAARGQAAFAATSCAAKSALACGGRFVCRAWGCSFRPLTPTPPWLQPAAKAALAGACLWPAASWQQAEGRRRLGSESWSVEMLPATAGMRNGQMG